MRNALIYSMLFIAIMITAGFYLRFELVDQIHEEIDQGLSRRAEIILNDTSPDDGTPRLFRKFANSVFVGGSESFLTDRGELIGPAKITVFGHDGFRTVPSFQLFDESYFDVVQNEFQSDHLAESDFDDEHADHLAETELWRVFVTRTTGGTVAVYTPIHEVEDALRLLPSIMLPITIATLIATISGGVLLGLTQQSRISRIHYALKQIASGNLAYRIEPQKARDDLDELMFEIDNTSQKLETSVRQLTDFSRNVAHELRTPLTQLRAFLEAPSPMQNLDAALAKTDEVIKIFDAIQRISRLGRSTPASNFEQVSLNEIAELMADLYQDIAEQNNQSLIIKTSGNEVVLGDRQLLAQLVSNLVENAIRYSGEGASIVIATSGKSISVEDNGPGIPEADRDKVFEPFFKCEAARNSKGTGLGLALVKAISNRHAASVNIETTSKGGNMISVRF